MKWQSRVKSLSIAEWGNTMVIEPMAHWWKRLNLKYYYDYNWVLMLTQFASLGKRLCKLEQIRAQKHELASISTLNACITGHYDEQRCIANVGIITHHHDISTF